MLEFMDYVQAAFYSTSRWNVDNSYSSLTATANSLVEFPVPHGIRLNISSLSSSNYATSYTFGNRGVVDGSLSFLFTSRALEIASRSKEVYLSSVIRGYRHLQELRQPDQNDGVHLGPKGPRRDALLYGRLYLPTSTLEAQYIRRISPNRLIRFNCVSDSSLPQGGGVLAVLQNDFGKYSTEYLYSTDSSLLGVRGLYNFGYDPRFPDHHLQLSSSTTASPRHPWDHQTGRLSAGAEIYFSPINKSGGMSTGLRFTTLPTHTGFPYTMTLTVNPLMGSLNSTYAVKAGPNLALCSCFDFNVYSYESEVKVGMELWQRKQPAEDIAWAVKKLRPGWPRCDDDVTGVLKARACNTGEVSLLWECRIKDLLFSLGAGFDLKQRQNTLGRIGVEISYSG